MTIRQGHNVIAGSSGRQLQDAFPLFFDHRFTFDPQDSRWVNSEAYSWLDGEVYRGGYNKLLSQYQPTGTFKATSLNYTCVFSDLSIVETSVPVATGTAADLQAWATSAGYTTTGTTIEELVVHKSLASSSETIANTTISFYRCYDKKKIVLTDQISSVEAIYAATGVAEYFILDIANKQFKLPRNKWGAYGTGSGDLGDYISESLPNITGTTKIGSTSYTADSITSGAFECDTSSRFRVGGGPDANLIPTKFDASRSSSTYQDNAPVQPRGAKGDLYFYLGSADIGGLADIASIKVETLNKKADRDLNNVSANIDFVIDSQEPTAENNYTWYRLYKSGWIEQGGFYDHGSLAKDWPATTVSYPKQMLDTTYTLLTQAGRNNSAAGNINNQSFVTFRDTTQFIVEVYGDGNSQFLWWKVEGYAKTI